MSTDDSPDPPEGARGLCVIACTAVLVGAAAMAVTWTGQPGDRAATPLSSERIAAAAKSETQAPPAPTPPPVRLDAAERTTSGGSAGALARWADERAERSGIPVRALRAYANASVIVAAAQPGCHLGWSTLAGIAAIESNHARHGGAQIKADGVVVPPIRGVALDGTAGNAVITAPAGSVGFARAMGPFQFIPDTWKRWGIRANTDQRVLTDLVKTGAPASDPLLAGNPDNIDDAALAAGRYLCAAGGDLSTNVGWRRAIFAYNHSEVYVDDVRRAALGYSQEGRR